MTETGGRSVLIVENERAVARQIQTCLALAGFRVSRVAQSVAEGLASVADLDPTVIVVDIALTASIGARDGLSAFALRRGTPIVYLSSSADRATIERAAEGYAAAYILKPFNERQLVSAVVLAAIAAERGSTLLMAPRPLTLAEKLRAIAAVISDEGLEDVTPSALRAAPRVERPSAPSHDGNLSGREREIVDLLANGARVVTIAQRLAISPHTVRNHLKSVFRKLNVHGQHELFEYWRTQRAV